MEKVIVVSENGPYIVRGGIPLVEKRITKTSDGWEWADGRELPQKEVYALCRCGKSKNAPFCDGKSHKSFKGQETADRRPFEERAERLEGPGLTILDDRRCSKSYFCHTNDGSTWEMLPRTGDPDVKEKVVRTCNACPSGRTVAVDRDGTVLEDKLPERITVIQHSYDRVGSGLYVTGGIKLVSSDGSEYPVQNRMVLCRCGNSRNKPFCDATHINSRFKDSNGLP